MKGVNRYILRLPKDFDLKQYNEKIGDNVIYQAAQYGAENEHLVQHSQLEAVPDTEKYLKKGDFVYMSHFFFDKLNQFRVSDTKAFASIESHLWTADFDKEDAERINLPVALFVLRGKKTKALYENNICDIMYKDKDVLSMERKPFAQRAKIIDSRKRKKGEVILFTKDADYNIRMGEVTLLCIPERWVFGKMVGKDIELKPTWNIVRALDEGDDWEKNSHGLYVQLKDMHDKGIGEVVQGEHKGKTVLFKKRSPLEKTQNDNLYVCQDFQIYAILDRYERV